jgi:TRAP transporter TAXI family solute receptor
MRFSIKLLWIGLLLSGAVTASLAQDLRKEANEGAVSIISGAIDGTYLRIAADMANVLDSDEVRILPVIGKGSLQNIEDLLYLRGIDLAIVQSDVMEYLRRKNTYPGIERKLHYITKLYNEEFHLLGADAIDNVADLAGSRVNFGAPGSGTEITASLIFDALGITVMPTYYDEPTALARLESGDIAALAYVTGKPARFFQNIPASAGLHLISVEPTRELLETYLPASLNDDDYPDLITAGSEISTVAVGAVLAAYSWKRGHFRHTKVANFIEHFFNHFADFLVEPRHPKWREVSLAAIVPGWIRFDTAQNWLDAHARNPPANSATAPPEQ